MQLVSVCPRRLTPFLLLISLFALIAPPSASAIPAFARKYGTSCTTCHTIYPKLTPFGEAFRRNGYRFPGTDSDYVKAEPLKMGQDEYKKLFPNAVWRIAAAVGADRHRF